MDVSKNNGTPQIIHFNRVFHYKPSIWGTPIFGNTRIMYHLLDDHPEVPEFFGLLGCRLDGSELGSMLRINGFCFPEDTPIDIRRLYKPFIY